MPIGMKAICHSPFDEPSNGLVFEMWRPAVLYGCDFSLRESNELNIHWLRLRVFAFWKYPSLTRGKKRPDRFRVPAAANRPAGAASENH
jgi:hypothetical protein